jgi:hypothetical protein
VRLVVSIGLAERVGEVESRTVVLDDVVVDVVGVNFWLDDSHNSTGNDREEAADLKEISPSNLEFSPAISPYWASEVTGRSCKEQAKVYGQDTYLSHRTTIKPSHPLLLKIFSEVFDRTDKDMATDQRHDVQECHNMWSPENHVCEFSAGDIVLDLRVRKRLICILRWFGGCISIFDDAKGTDLVVRII